MASLVPLQGVVDVGLTGLMTAVSLVYSTFPIDVALVPITKVFDTLDLGTTPIQCSSHCSYAATVEGVSILVATKPVMQGETFYVQLNKKDFSERLALYKISLIVRIIF